MVKAFPYKPKWTQWIRCRTYVAYDCEAKPTGGKTKITGLAQIGFILSHEYEIEANVVKSSRKTCQIPGCNRAVSYTFDLAIDVYDKYGIGFGFGKGTGVLGIPIFSHTDRQTFVTDCECCDDDGPSMRSADAVIAAESAARSRAAAESPVAVVAATTAVGVALAFSLIYPGHWLSQAFLDTTGALTGLSALAMISRFWASRSAKKEKRPENTPTLNA